MFQIALGHLLKQSGHIVCYDALFYYLQYVHKLKNSGVAFRKVLVEDIFPNLKLKIANPVNMLLYRLARKIHPNISMNRQEYIYREPYYCFFDKELLRSFSSQRYTAAYLRGYFQNEKYFHDYKDEILKLFKFPEFEDKTEILLSCKIQSKRNPVCLHIRQGDYLNCHITVASIDYYRKAIEYIKENVSDPYFFCFGQDNIELIIRELRIKENFEVVNIRRNTSDKDFRDMQLMSLCKHFILANSTFSWWAAYLSNTDGITIAPTPWMAEKDEIICENWIKMPI